MCACVSSRPMLKLLVHIMVTTWWCQCCKKHRSAFPRKCICCKLWIAPGCMPEQCLVMDEEHGAPFNLCRKCAALMVLAASLLLKMLAENAHAEMETKRQRLT